MIKWTASRTIVLLGFFALLLCGCQPRFYRAPQSVSAAPLPSNAPSPLPPEAANEALVDTSLQGSGASSSAHYKMSAVNVSTTTQNGVISSSAHYKMQGGIYVY